MTAAYRFASLFLALLVLPGIAGANGEAVTVGSKKFTESVILGEIIRHVAVADGHAVRHRAELGGSRVLFNALQASEIDAYAEYTGTLIQELLTGEAPTTHEALRRSLAARGIGMLAPLGFDNTYAIGMREDRAEALGIRRISDLVAHPDLVFGFSHEFLDRGDGWPGLRQRYGLPQAQVRGLDHDLAYRALAAGPIDAMDVYTTDAEIAYYGLRALVDDRDFFREYRAVVLYRLELTRTAPDLVAALRRLSGQIDEAAMIAMNRRVKLDGETEAAVAGEFVAAKLGLETHNAPTSVASRLLQHTAEHLSLVGLSLSAAIAIGVPLGIAAARLPRLGHAILGLVGVVQTIPSLALFVFMIPLLGIGAVPAIAALFLYSLLPIVRNVHAGLCGIPPDVRESALALGLPARTRLLRIELPLSAATLLAGIKTAAVINVGTATLAALIGAGGYGQPILTGIRLDDTALILQGAVPAALLALAAQGLFGWIERGLVPRGLRLPDNAIGARDAGSRR
jgi:osmoprotectant transport system permease protein